MCIRDSPTTVVPSDWNNQYNHRQRQGQTGSCQNSNIATTGHKLQGMSKDILIVNDWNYQCVNWVYVVLSRVRTLAGLYLMKPLDLERGFNVPQNLIRFEQRLKANKERPILDMMGFQSNAKIETMQWRISESSKSNEKVHRNSSLADVDRIQELILQ